MGAIASAADIILDQRFRLDMHEVHRLLSPEELKEYEDAVTNRLKELGLYPEDLNGQPKMAIDWYKQLNDELGLKSPHRLRPSNHRILNHTDKETAIELLIKGESGLGGWVHKYYPKMSLESATELFDLHLKADLGTPASVPLRIMSWLWEQSIHSKMPEKIGDPNLLFSLLQRYGPNLDWSRWLNEFCKNNPIPEGANIGEAMLKLAIFAHPLEKVKVYS